jgi:hypothetical protein
LFLAAGYVQLAANMMTPRNVTGERQKGTPC